MGKPREAAEANYCKEKNGNHMNAMLVRGRVTSGFSVATSGRGEWVDI